MLIIDGSEGEGGGQVLRTSLSLSALTGRPFQMKRIRGNRSRPGLRPQHLTAVQAVATVCQAEVEGAALDSTTLIFRPTRPPQGGDYEFDVTEASPSGRSAGAVTLIFQALLWPLLFAAEPTRLRLRGGTQVPFSPSYHYLAHVAAPTFAQLGVPDLQLNLAAWGWMAEGGGTVTAVIPLFSRLQATTFTRPVVERVEGVAAVTNLPAHIAQRMARRAYNLLTQAGLTADIQPLRERGTGPGAGICLWLPQAGFSALGQKGLPADKVAETAVSDLLSFLGIETAGTEYAAAAVDPHLADQLLIPMALAYGRSRFTTNQLSQHTLTNAALLRRWLDVDITISAGLGQPGQVTVVGIGYQGGVDGHSGS
jgi:RNA 3'-terminal phosphate cyclase (ATP)